MTGKHLRALALAATVSLAACAGHSVTVPVQAGSDPMELDASLALPKGDGPFPAAVFMHGCGGLKYDPGIAEWASWFRDRGYATLIVDSFTPRHWGYVCTDPALTGPDGSRVRVADAKAAYKFLSADPKIDPKTVVLVGFSHGALTALMTGLERPAVGYAGYVAFYPYCRGADFDKGFTAPTTVMIGELDDWTPAELCEEVAEWTKVQLHVYDLAYHGFDRDEPVRTVQGCCSGGHLELKHVGYNADADRQAHANLDAFLKSLR